MSFLLCMLADYVAWHMRQKARKGWRRGAAAAEVLVPLVFAPGEAYQFDWSYEIVIVAGVDAGDGSGPRRARRRNLPARHGLRR